MLSKLWMTAGSFFGFFGVVLGAFGAHGLKNILSDKSLAIYQTAVQYQMIHALVLLALGIWTSQNSLIHSAACGYSFIVGIVLFSGSLYSLALTDIKVLGAITPLGGLSFLFGWIAFAFLAWRA